MGTAALHNPPSARSDRFADLDIVDAAYVVPPDLPIRGFSRTDAGVVLDRELVALSGVHARIRLIQAKLARRFIDLRGWNHAGFVRLSDYSREMLGIASRTLEDDARVVRALDRLPKLRGLLESGALVWSRARVLVRVATPANEERLITEASPVPLRELDEFVRRFVSTDECESSLDEASSRSSPSSEDPVLRWGITISRSGRRLWRAACEMASRMAGKEVSRGEVLELVAAEASSGSLAGGAPGASGWSAAPEVHEQWLRARLQHDEDRGRRSLLAFLAETGVAEGFAWLDPASRDPGPAARLDALLAGVEALDPIEITRRLQELRMAAQRIDAQMAALLFIGINRRLFREIGFATVRLYVEARLGCCSRTVWSMVAVERDSWRHAPQLRAAWREGRITHLQAVELLSVISEQNADAWIEHAEGCTLRKLKDDVAWALDHGAAPSSSTRPLPPGEHFDVRMDGLGDIELTEVQMRAHGEVADASLGPPGAVRIECMVPLSVAVMLETTLDLLERPGEARWQTFERMIACALLEWMAQPRHRDPVFERDGWRCSVPGCTSRRELHDHHVRFRSLGGGDERDNRITVCAGHHLHGIHAGRIRASGRAPSGVVWELGCAPGRRPLMRLRGDRVLERAA